MVLFRLEPLPNQGLAARTLGRPSACRDSVVRASSTHLLSYPGLCEWRSRTGGLEQKQQVGFGGAGWATWFVKPLTNNRQKKNSVSGRERWGYPYLLANPYTMTEPVLIAIIGGAFILLAAYIQRDATIDAAHITAKAASSVPTSRRKRRKRRQTR